MNERIQLEWHEAHEWRVAGKGWAETRRPYDRLPGYAQKVLPQEVWDLSRYSTGLYVEFETDSPEIHARWLLLTPRLALAHMPASAVSGVDLYAQEDSGHWRWVAVGSPEIGPQVQLRLTYGLTPGHRRYRLYLPLFNGVESLAIGIPAGAYFQPQAPRILPPIVVYGTSIVQGIAASRAGMCHTAILGRWLNHPIINLGLSGRGKMEIAVAELLAEIDAAIYVVDCLPNLEPPLVEERSLAFMSRLNELRGNTPLVLIEDRTYANSWAVPLLAERNRQSRSILRNTRERLVEAGISNLYYIGGDTLLGDDDEATVDGTHPTDLGFMRIAEHLRPILATLIGRSV